MDMKTHQWHRNALAAAFLAASAGCLSADPALMLTPSPGLSGPPGNTVGWGFTIVNDTSDYLEFSSSQFCLNPVLLTPVLSCTPPLTGVFSDIIVGNDPIIGPHSSLSENFDPINFTSGIGYFDINPGATPMSLDTGEIVLIYDGYDQNPNLGPANQLLFSVPMTADTSVTVTHQAVVPEPSTAALWALAFTVLAMMRLRASSAASTTTALPVTPPRA